MYCKKNKTYDNKKIKFKKIIKDILYKTFFLGMTCDAFTQTVYANDLATALEKADNIGKAFWKLLLLIGYWVIAIYGGKDILTEVTQGETKDVIKVVTKYGIGFACLVLFLHALDLIKSLG
uniref:Uncharacterized protein n=2 Tax=Clostridium TaxID=1485 RepID=A0AA40IRH8_CLONO|nr:hypothetical protein Z959_p0020 [Clostridium novyi B str. ATCC 27606]